MHKEPKVVKVFKVQRVLKDQLVLILPFQDHRDHKATKDLPAHKAPKVAKA